MKHFYFLVLLLTSLLSLLNTNPVAAQIQLTDLTPYKQDFNKLSTAAGVSYFNNNVTLPGVYAQAVLDGLGPYPSAGSPIPYYGNDGGQRTEANYYSFGTVGNTDRALGGIATSIVAGGQPLVGNGYVAMRFINKTGRTIANLEVSYAMEQWYNSGKIDKAQVLFDYQIQAAAFSGMLQNGTWTNVPALNIDAPSTAMVVSSKNGNAPANRRALNAIINNLNLADGKEVVLRWKYVLNKDTNGNGLSIDDVTVTPQAGNVATSATTTQTGTSGIFYYSGSGDLDKLNSWVTKPDNTRPASFTADNQIFYVTTNGKVPLKSNMISGKNSKLIIGDGSSTSAVTVVMTPDNNAATTIDVASNGTLEISGTAGNLPKLGRLAAGSTVYYNSDRTDISINNGNFGNLKLNGKSVKVLASNVSVSGTLSLAGGSILQLNVYDLTMLKGGAVITDGSAYVRTNAGGALRQTVANNNAAVLFPVGQGTYNPAWLTQTTAGVEDVFGISISDSIFTKYVTPATYSNDKYDDKGKGREKKGSGKPLTVSSTNVSHTWYVSEAELGGSNVSMTLQSELPTTVDPNQVMLNHYHNDYWDKNATQKGGSVVDQANRVYKFTRTGVTDFSPFGLGAETPLPVELSAFGAKNTGSVVVCTWTTASEQDNDHFLVERSLDGQQFHSLATVAGAGNSSTVRNYRWVDAQPASTTAYYRLRQVDKDGTFVFSPVVAVKGLAVASTITAAPNPSTGPLTLTLNTTEATILRGTITNMVGAEVLRFAQPVGAGVHALPLDLSAQSAGVYLVRIQTPQGPQTLRVVKQ